MLRVAELWHEVLPPGASLLAGAGGLDGEVTWPARLRSRPPAFGQLKGGEVALVRLHVLQQLDPNLRLARVVSELRRAGVVAVVIDGEAPEDARVAADDAGLPLLAVPPGASLTDVEHAVTQAILERRSDAQRRSRELERELMELAIQGRGLPAIAARVGAGLRRSAWVLTAEGQTFAEHRAKGDRLTLTTATARELVQVAGERLLHQRLPAADPPVVAVTAGSHSFITAPIVQDGRPFAFLALDGASPATALDRAATAWAAAACAVEIARSHAVLAAQRTADEQPLLVILDAETHSDLAATRAARLGLDLRAPRVVAVVRGAAERPLATSALRALQVAVGPESVWAWDADAALAVLTPALADPRQLQATVAAALDGQQITLGLGRPYTGVPGLRRSHHEALAALRIGTMLHGADAATAFGDLGVYRVLCQPEQAEDIRDFCTAMLSTLQQHDAAHGSELLRTLDAYLRSGGSPTETAARLGLHRNTVLYRLQRIVAVAGLDLDNADRRLELYLALRADEVLRALGLADGGAPPPG